MRFIKLITTNGNAMWINPDHITTFWLDEKCIKVVTIDCGSDEFYSINESMSNFHKSLQNAGAIITSLCPTLPPT